MGRVKGLPFSVLPSGNQLMHFYRKFYFFFLHHDLLTAASPERHNLQGEAEDAGCDDGDGKGRDVSRGEYGGRRSLVLLLLLGWGGDFGGGAPSLRYSRRSFVGGATGLSDGMLEDLAGGSPKEKWERGWRRRRVEGWRRRCGDPLFSRTSNRRGRRCRHRHGWLWSAAVLFIGT